MSPASGWSRHGGNAIEAPPNNSHAPLTCRSTPPVNENKKHPPLTSLRSACDHNSMRDQITQQYFNVSVPHPPLSSHASFSSACDHTVVRDQSTQQYLNVNVAHSPPTLHASVSSAYDHTFVRDQFTQGDAVAGPLGLSRSSNIRSGDVGNWSKQESSKNDRSSRHVH